MAYIVGDKVHWVSQAGGFHVAKVGTVVEVVSAGRHPSEVHGGFGLRGVGSPRDRESYVVHVEGKTSRSKGKRYWPVASLLKKGTPQ